jgi:hypothetical protein
MVHDVVMVYDALVYDGLVNEAVNGVSRRRRH